MTSTGIGWRCLVSRWHWWPILRLRCNRPSCWYSLHHGLWWAKSNLGPSLFSKVKIWFAYLSLSNKRCFTIDKIRQLITFWHFRANSGIRKAEEGIKSYTDLGIPVEKLVLGLPWYGYKYPCKEYAVRLQYLTHYSLYYKMNQVLNFRIG